MAEYAPHSALRADVRASYGPGLPVVYYDVVVAHPFTTGVPTGSVGALLGAQPDADAAVHSAEQRKYGKYAAPCDPASGVALVRPVTAVPLAFDTFGRWGPAATEALKRWARRCLLRPDAVRSVRKAGLYQQVLTRWRASGACALQRGNYEVFAASVGLASPGPAPEGDERSVGVVPFVRYLTDRAVIGA